MLLIGARCSGKTYYLRRCRHKPVGIAFLGGLKYILNSISHDVGGAGLSYERNSASFEFMINSKTAALLCSLIADQAIERLITPPFNIQKKMVSFELKYHNDILYQVTNYLLVNFFHLKILIHL